MSRYLKLETTKSEAWNWNLKKKTWMKFKYCKSKQDWRAETHSWTIETTQTEQVHSILRLSQENWSFAMEKLNSYLFYVHLTFFWRIKQNLNQVMFIKNGYKTIKHILNSSVWKRNLNCVLCRLNLPTWWLFIWRTVPLSLVLCTVNLLYQVQSRPGTWTD